MSSDYIDRLRHELLRAGASSRSERRLVRVKQALRPLPAVAAAVAVALIAVALVLAWPADRTDERPVQPAGDGVQMSFRLEPSGAAAAERTAQVMRERLAAAGVDDADVSVSSSGGLTVTAPAADRDAVTALTHTGRVAFYDWERSVLGPDGTPAPADPSVTGGPDAGAAVAITKAEAEARANRSPGGRVVRAEAGRSDGWFALGGEPALTDADVAGAEPTVDQARQEPVVTVELTADGQAAFTELTRELARRGDERAAAGVDDLEAMQHLAIVIDDRIVNVPYINFRMAPNGIDGADGVYIVGNLTPETARQTAAIVSTGPLPAALVSP
jgi:preprotein translocase subunit SecD